ncbi:RtcB family protein [Burkholderia multivorans]|uniref:RtcB family protein n=1 Tax=Burkholderia multivorans TaxID=87883 RepID=UPI003BAA355A
MPFIFKHVAVMPDVHLGKGSTIGSVIPTKGAIIPAAVGVDIGCGMMAARTTLSASDLPDSLAGLRSAIERAVPHGRAPGRRDPGAWGDRAPTTVADAWQSLLPGFQRIVDKYPKLEKTNHYAHLGTLGTGNHFIEVCIDEADRVWFMLHSGSRGVGNAIGSLFIELAQADMRQHIANLPDRNLAYFNEGSRHFDDYVEAVGWAQDYARRNRQLMMEAVIEAARRAIGKPFAIDGHAVNCHHNYVRRGRPRDPQGCGVRAEGAARHHSGLDGCEELHRARAGQRGKLLLVQPRRGPDDEPDRSEAPLHRRRPGEGDARRRMPEGRGCRRRNPDGLQGHRRGDGGPAQPRRSDAYAAAGGVRERIARCTADGRRPHNEGKRQR